MPLRGYTQGSKAAPGTGVVWPAGTVAGDVALVHCGGQYAGLGPDGDGWSAVGHKTWWKVVTATDLATSLVVVASHVKLQTFSGASGIGRTSSQAGITTQHAGSALWVDCARRTSGIAPATHRLGSEWTDENGWVQACYYRSGAPAGAYLRIDGIASGTDCYAYEILPLLPPAAPILVSPNAGQQVDVALATPLSWLHQSGTPQQQRRIRITLSGVVVGWLRADGTIAAAEQTVTSAAQVAEVAPGAFTAGGNFGWAVATASEAGFGPYSSPRPISPVTAPTITSVSMSAPAGDLTPTVTVAATAGSGVLEAWRVWITPASAPDVTTALWGSGVITGAPGTISSPPQDWDNGATYKAWAEVWQTGGVGKRSTSLPIPISWTPPATPSVSAAATAPTTVTVSGLTIGSIVTVQASTDGVAWAPLTTFTAAATSASLTAPLTIPEQPAHFRAQQATMIDIVPMRSAWSLPATVVVVDRGAYLVDDHDRATYIAVTQARESDPARTLVQTSTTTYGLGATLPRIDATPPAGYTGSLTIWVRSEAEADSLTDWLLARDVFWWRQTPDVGPAGTRLPVDPIRIARTNAISVKRISDMAGWRLITIEWVQQ